jgi:hypothetical protein
MGYYSKFSLRVEPASKHDYVARELTRMAYGDHVLEDGVTVFDHEHWNDGKGCKWYSHADDCIVLSRSLPGVVIRIQRRGEDGEVWRYVYADGEQVSAVWRGPAHIRDVHIDAQGNAVDLTNVDDRYLRNIVRWSCRVLREARRSNYPVTAKLKAMARRETFAAAIDECAWRGILPTAEELEVAWDRAQDLGHVDPRTGKPIPREHPVAGPLREGETRRVYVDHGPRDLIELWVGYGQHTYEKKT